MPKGTRAFAFANRLTAETLKQMARERLSRPQPGRGGAVQLPGPAGKHRAAYVLFPKEVIPAAYVVKVGSEYHLHAGSGQAYL